MLSVPTVFVLSIYYGYIISFYNGSVYISLDINLPGLIYTGVISLLSLYVSCTYIFLSKIKGGGQCNAFTHSSIGISGSGYFSLIMTDLFGGTFKWGSYFFRIVFTVAVLGLYLGGDYFFGIYFCF